MKKRIKILSLVLFLICILLGSIYLGLAVYYQNGFCYGTWINGIYCTGKTVEEVNTELLSQFSYEQLEIILPESTEVLKASELDYQFDFTESLNIYLKQQNPYLWIQNLFKDSSEKIIYPIASFDQAKFDEKFNELAFVKQKKTMPEPEVKIIFTQNGWELKDDRTKALNLDIAKEKIRDSLQRGLPTIDLEQEQCYETLDYSEEMKRTLSLWEKIDRFQSFDLTYLFGNQTEKISKLSIANWLSADLGSIPKVDENGNLIVEESKIRSYIKSLADKYDTYQNHRILRKDGSVVWINTGNYGNEIDQESETEFLLGAIQTGLGGEHEPVYLHEAKFKGLDDIGPTYIEIDMTNQRLYYYADRELVLETDIVTGNTGRKMGTPQKVCYVYGKQKRRILKGPNYAAFVNYWMPVSGNIGIHDATWRKEFGGEIYKTAGSHGCINTPLENMEKLYELVEIGTPVIMYY